MKSNTDINGIVDYTVSTRSGCDIRICINYSVHCYDKIPNKCSLRNLGEV